MIKIAFGGKEYWVGYNPKLGHLIFDPLVQSEQPPDAVRLFVIGRNKSSSFKKEIIRNKLSPDAALNASQCRKLSEPYANARAKLRVTHCYNCSNNLSTTDFCICDKCRWIQCSCGACGCQYARSEISERNSEIDALHHEVLAEEYQNDVNEEYQSEVAMEIFGEMQSEQDDLARSEEEGWLYED